MRLVNEIQGPELHWAQVKTGQRAFELRAGEEGEVVANLAWKKGGGTLAEAETGQGKFSFKPWL